MSLPANVIYGLEGGELTASEKDFFREVNPYGYILFARNVENPQQLLRLTDSLRALAGNTRLPILIDQEGGRVARLRPPYWPEFPSARQLVQQGGGDISATQDIIYNNAVKLGLTLRQSGITVNCAPVADLLIEDSDPIIGDRAYAKEPELVSLYADAMARGLVAGGVLPVLKHIPGHGRATVDSHISLPMVDTPLEQLAASDFKPFASLAHLPFAMTAHIVFSALDKGNCVTFSPSAIRYIRETIGYRGIIMTDDLSMHALSGHFTRRTEKALAAGCDLVLHCNGKMAEMEAIAQAVKPISDVVASLSNQALKQANAKPSLEMA